MLDRADIHDLRRSLAAMGVREFVRRLHLERGAQFSARSALVLCPAHQERTASCSIHFGQDRTFAVRCHGCDWSGDALHLVAQVHGLEVRRDFREVLLVAAELAGRWDLAEQLRGTSRTAPQPRPPVAKVAIQPALAPDRYDAIASTLLGALKLDGDGAEYMERRCIFADAQAVGVVGLPPVLEQGPVVASLLEAHDRAELEAAGLLLRGEDRLAWAAHRLVIPWRSRAGRVTCLQRRVVEGVLGGHVEPRYVFPPGFSPREPFGVELLAVALASYEGDTPVIVTEGALDCLARRKLARELGETAIVLAVPSATSFRVEWSELFDGRDVCVSFDADQAGDRAAERFSDECLGGARSVHRDRPHAKDWGETLVAWRARGAAA